MATKKFKCTVCGYIHEGKAAPETCPVCAAPASVFVEIEDAKKKGMLSDKNGNAYIIMYSTVMVVIVATLLAVAALSLQKRQYANELNEKKSSILSSLSAQGQNYDTFIDAYVVDARGEKVEGQDVFEYGWSAFVEALEAEAQRRDERMKDAALALRVALHTDGRQFKAFLEA